MRVKAIHTRVFQEHEPLVPFILKYLPRVPEKSVVVITSKIVALSQGRVVADASKVNKERLIKKESELAIHTKYVWLTVTGGTVMASAGIDESNAHNKLILLPRQSQKVAKDLRATLKWKYRVRELGVLITDSCTMPLRAGVTGMALGYAGFSGLRDYRGLPDIFGRKFKFSRVNVADSLAAAATLGMGEGAEQQPLGLITGAPLKWVTHTKPRELAIDLKDDMYAPLFSHLHKGRRLR